MIAAGQRLLALGQGSLEDPLISRVNERNADVVEEVAVQRILHSLLKIEAEVEVSSEHDSLRGGWCICHFEVSAERGKMARRGHGEASRDLRPQTSLGEEAMNAQQQRASATTSSSSSWRS